MNMDANDNNVIAVSEFIKDRLYFMTFINTFDLSRGGPFVHYFCTDELFKYENFYDDFGPLNLSMLYRYCHTLNIKMRHIRATKIVHAASDAPKKKVNAAYLIGCYAMIYLDFTPQQAYETLTVNSDANFIEFRDASSAEPHTINLLDCFAGLHKAKTMGFFNFENFDCEHYEFYERIENGDLNWIVPRKFLAFSGPSHVCENIGSYPVHAVAFYYRYFRSNGVTTVIRLNKRAYSASLFTSAGFAHRDLYFMDGSTPTDEILNEFLNICESTTGAVAVHCKAGLGRTGTLIACYVMKHYRFTAREAIAWIRICRPGSIIGPQQEWLLSKMTDMWHEGQVYRRRRWRGPAALPGPPIHRTPIYAIHAGQPFIGHSSKFHRQHVRLHCRTIVPQPFFMALNSNNSKGRFTTLPSTKGNTVNDSFRAKNRMKQRQLIRAQQQAATRVNSSRFRLRDDISDYDIDFSGDSDSDIESHARLNYNFYNDVGFVQAADTNAKPCHSKENQVLPSRSEREGDNIDVISDEAMEIVDVQEIPTIQRKVNTMKLDDGAIEPESDDDCEHNTDSEESDDEDEGVANNNNQKQAEIESAEESEDTDIGEEVVETNVNIPIAGNSHNNNIVAKASNEEANPVTLTQGDKLNMIKAQRTHHTQKTEESTSRCVAPTKVVVKASEMKSTPTPHVMTLRSYTRMSNQSSKTSIKTPLCTHVKSTNTKRRDSDGNTFGLGLNSNDDVARNSVPRTPTRTNVLRTTPTNNVQRSSARIAAKVAAAAVAAKTSSSSSASSASEDKATNRKSIRPNSKVWVCRIVRNSDTNFATSTPLSGMEPRAKRALTSERRNVSIYRKTNQVGAPTRTRKVDAATTSKQSNSVMW